MGHPTLRRSPTITELQGPADRVTARRRALNLLEVMELERSRDIHVGGLGNLSGGMEMAQREKLTFVYDADGSIGVVMEFSESDFEAYSMPDLALIGAFQTKAQAAQALATRMHLFRH